MSEQDIDDSDIGDESPEQEGDETAEELSEIAEEPDDDVDVALSEIIASEESEELDADGVGLADVDLEDVDIEGSLVEEMETAEPETLARVFVALQEETSRLREELAETRERADDFESRLKRKQADFQNYKKRQKKRLEEEKQRATEDLVERLIDVRDNLRRALEQDEDADIRGGVETTLKQFDQQLDRENVEPIEPEPGAETDPQRHEVLATVAGENPEGTIETVHRDGYEMAGKVLRPAQVAVSDGSNHEREEENET